MMYPKDLYLTTNLLKTGLEAIGYRHETILQADGKYFSRYTAPSGRCWVALNSRISYPFVNSSAKEISKDKALAYALAAANGVTVPFTRIVEDDEDGASVWDDVKAMVPLIVKPGSSTLSRGLTRQVDSKEKLETAISEARHYPGSVLVQQQVTGGEIRFAVFDGVCKAAILRLPPRLAGDGHSSIRQLLGRENRERAKLRLPYATYPQLEAPIIDTAPLDMDSVLPDGEIVVLGDSAMIRMGASAYNVTDEVDESYKQAAAKLGASLGNGFVAVDFLVADHTKPMTADNYAFLEFNMAPNLGVFYGCRDGQQYDILKELVPMIDRAVQGGNHEEP